MLQQFRPSDRPTRRYTCVMSLNVKLPVRGITCDLPNGVIVDNIKRLKRCLQIEVELKSNRSGIVVVAKTFL